MKLALDESLISQVRGIINSTNIFYKSPEFIKKWNLFCAFMDRIEDTARALNKLKLDSDLSWSTEEIILVFVYTDIIKSGIEKLLKDLDLKKLEATRSDIFGQGNDDEFFKHLRNLVFAHTLDTDRSNKYVLRGEEQYAPYLVDNPKIRKMIHVKVYSNLRPDDEVELFINKQDLIEYIDSKYIILSQIIIRLTNIISEYELKWLETKVDIGEDIHQTLKNLRRECINRFDEYTLGVVSELEELFSFTSDIKRNQDVVDEFRDYVENQIYSFIERYNSFATIDNHPLYDAFNQPWKSNEEMSNYILEKITMYLTEDYAGVNDYSFTPGSPIPDMRNVYFGFTQLKEFKEKLSDQYVDIDYNMKFADIQILISAALFIHNKSTAK